MDLMHGQKEVDWKCRRKRGLAFLVVSPLMVFALTTGLGCSRNEPTIETEEPIEILDLVDSFSEASGPRVASVPMEDRRLPKPYVNSERKVLFVPLGRELAYEIEVLPGGVLLSGKARNVGTASGYLEVIWAPNAGAERILTRDFSAAPDRIACFGNTEHESGRLILRASTAVKDDDPGAGIRIFNPKVAAGVSCDPPGSVEKGHRDHRPNIVVYLIDALRADRIGCYGYDRGTTPHVDEFASSAILFSGAQAQTSWTRPAVASIFTGLLPQQHGTTDKKDVLPESATTIAELLTGAGYESAAVVSNGNVDQVYGFSQGFSYYKYLEEVEIGEHVVRSDDVNQAVFSWLDEFRATEPFFLYVHTVDPHLPYAPPPTFRDAFAPNVHDSSIGSTEAVNEVAANRDRVTPKMVEQLSDLYDGEVAANDASFGEFYAGLGERGLLENTVVVVLSDHGEEFFDHGGWTHGNTLHAEMLDVPLIIRIPGVTPRSIPEIVQHVDLFSTLLDLAGVEPPAGVFGRSARPLWTEGVTAEWTNRGLSHLELKERFGEAWVDPQWKIITRRLRNGDLRTSLFNRETDPTERSDLASRRQDLVEELLGRYAEEVSAAGDALQGVEIDEGREAEVEAQLKALGYL